MIVLLAVLAVAVAVVAIPIIVENKWASFDLEVAFGESQFALVIAVH